MSRPYRTITVRHETSIDVPEYGQWIDESELIDMVKRSGSHFFHADTMRGFRSRVHDIRPGPDGWYFITSEKHVAWTSYCSINEPRKYTVRRLRVRAAGDALKLDTIGGFQAYPTLGRARTALKHFAANGALVCDRCTGSPEHETWCPSLKTEGEASNG